MPLYSIMIDNHECTAVESTLLEMYPGLEIISHPLIFSRIYELELTKNEYTFLALKHKLPPHRTHILRKYP